MSGIYIQMEMPKSCGDCRFCGGIADTDCGPCAWCNVDGNTRVADTRQDCPLIPVPDHGRLIDGDTLVADLKRQCKEVFKTDAVSPDDSWITRNQAYNERLWTTWCESLFDYLKAAPTIIPADKEGEG